MTTQTSAQIADCSSHPRCCTPRSSMRCRSIEQSRSGREEYPGAQRNMAERAVLDVVSLGMGAAGHTASLCWDPLLEAHDRDAESKRSLPGGAQEDADL